MKLGPVAKLDKGNTRTLKKIQDDVLYAKYYVIVIFSIDGWFGAIWKPDLGHKVYNTNIFINSYLLSYRNWKQN